MSYMKPNITPGIQGANQSFKDECNINKIMAKFQKTGALNHFAKHQPQYGDATHLELRDALQIVANAETMFAELPSELRKKFKNDPQEFLEFVQDEKNVAEMEELGLKPKKTTSLSTGDQTPKQSENTSVSTENTEVKDGGKED